MRIYCCVLTSRHAEDKTFQKSGHGEQKATQENSAATMGAVFVLIFCYSALLIVKNRRTTSLQVHYLGPFFFVTAFARTSTCFWPTRSCPKEKAPRAQYRATHHLISK